MRFWTISVTISVAEFDRTAIRVTDTGPGMTTEMLASILNKEANGTSPQGLRLAKEIGILHGGDLEAKCGVGMGCEFTLRIPLVRPNVLIVDDDQNFRHFLSRSLRQMEASVVEANDGATAIDILDSGREFPHLIISDLDMPKITGLDLLSYLRSNDKTKSIPVIIVSGKVGLEASEDVLVRGALGIFYEGNGFGQTNRRN